MSADGGAHDSSRGYQTPREKALDCPHCGAYVAVDWAYWGPIAHLSQVGSLVGKARCPSCDRILISLDHTLIYPNRLVGPLPAADMSAPVREIYEEARAVASASPRAAAALLRVAVEMLVDDLEPGRANLSAKIGKLVEHGLDPQIQQMLDTVRVFGNEGGAHPGEINMNEQPEVLGMLMFCVNTIVERMITYPNRIAALYGTVPELKRKGIEDRDRAVHTPNDAGSGQDQQ